MNVFSSTLVIVGLKCVADFLGGNETPKHLSDARNLVKNLDLKNTSYAHGQPKVHFSEPYSSHTDCSGFLDALLQHSYRYTEADFAKWFGSKRPTAEKYHDAIQKGVGFKRITLMKNVRPGDILAVKYLTEKDNTGHIMIVAGEPKSRDPSEPIVKDSYRQWEVAIIDSSMSGHGSSDTRHKKGKEGKDHNGLGEGILRIYTNQQDQIVGFSWSTAAISKFADMETQHMVVGRLKAEFKP
jgi:hypothetical protein